VAALRKRPECTSFDLAGKREFCLPQDAKSAKKRRGMHKGETGHALLRLFGTQRERNFPVGFLGDLGALAANCPTGTIRASRICAPIPPHKAEP